MAPAVRETVVLGVEVFRTGTNPDSHLVSLAYYVMLGPMRERIHQGLINFETKWPLVKGKKITTYRMFDPEHWNTTWATRPHIEIYQQNPVLVRSGLAMFAAVVDELRRAYNVVVASNKPDDVACLTIHTSRAGLVVLPNLLSGAPADKDRGFVQYANPREMIRSLPDFVAHFVQAEAAILLPMEGGLAITIAESYALMYMSFTVHKEQVEALVHSCYRARA